MDCRKQPNESKWAYIYRVYSNQELIGSNDTLGELCRQELGEDFDESAYRKPYQYFKLIFDEIKDQFLDGKYLKDLDEKMDLLYKQQVKTRDQNREKRKTLRDEARIEVIIDAIRQSAESAPKLNPIYRSEIINCEDGNEAVLDIGDWHVGDEFYNFYNSYNKDILTERVNSLIEQTVHYCKINNVTKLNVINTGDMIAGNIHAGIRIESELDMVEAIKLSAWLIAQLLTKLSEEIKEVNYRSCLDNHSRMTADIKEHIEKESFAYLIDWWLEEKLKETKVRIMNDNIDEDIGYFQLNNGQNVFFVHGHLDSVHSVIQDLTFATGIIADIVFMGHWHKDSMKPFQGKVLYINGTLKGTDTYAKNKRLFGSATQGLFIFDKLNTIDIRIHV